MRKSKLSWPSQTSCVCSSDVLIPIQLKTLCVCSNTEALFKKKHLIVRVPRITTGQVTGRVLAASFVFSTPHKCIVQTPFTKEEEPGTFPPLLPR